MTASLHTLQPRHYRRNRVSNLHGCPIVTLAEHRSLVSRYQDSCRQADVLNASIGELWLRAYLASINYALVIAGLHVHNNGRDTCAKENPRSPKLSPDGAA